MKICPYCNNYYEDYALYCNKCGTQLVPAADTPPDYPSQETPQYDYTQQAYNYTQQAYDYTQQAYDSTQQAYDYTQQAYDSTQQENDYTQQTYGYTQQAYTYPPVQPVPAQKKPKKKRTGLIVGIIAAVLAFFIMIGVAGGEDSSDAGASNHLGGSSGYVPNETQNVIPSNTSDKTKTVMVYMVGSDLESKYGAASVDILEMLESGVNTDNHNIMIYTGGTKQWAISEIPVDKNCIYQLKGEEFLPVKEYESANMGSSSTLEEFISFCVDNYKTDAYGLILWDHGAGPLVGYGVDELHEDILEMSELQSALKSAGFGSGKKLEFLGFDACLMGSVETAWGVKDYANYLIASQETEPGTGWDYSFLQQLDNCDTGKDIGTAIIDAYFSGYAQIVAQNPQDEADLTLSCLDLSKVDKVETGLNNLFAKVDANILSGYFPKASQKRNKVKSFGKYATSFEYDLIDIFHMVSLLSPDYSAEATQLNADLEEFVCYSKSNVENASGVSIYHPYDNTQYMNSWVTQFKKLGFASEYADYISNFSTMLANPSSPSWDTFGTTRGSAVKQGANNELSIQLSEEQKQNYADASYYILKKIKDDEYMFIFAGFDTELSTDGTLSASYNNKAVFAVNDKTGEPSDAPITMYQVRDGSGEQKYCASAIFWLFADDITDWRTDPVEWQIKIEDGKPKALSAYLIEGANGEEIPQKQLLDYTQYSSVEFSFSTRIPKKDAAGNLLPYFQWDSTGWFYGNDYDVAEGFHFECREIDNKEDYFVMFVVRDVQGNTYASDMFTLPG